MLFKNFELSEQV